MVEEFNKPNISDLRDKCLLTNPIKRVRSRSHVLCTAIIEGHWLNHLLAASSTSQMQCTFEAVSVKYSNELDGKRPSVYLPPMSLAAKSVLDV